MKCADVDRLLSEGVPVVQLRARPKIEEHLAGCSRCGELIVWVETPLTEPGLSEPMVDRIKTIIHTDLRPVRPLPSAWGWLMGVFGLTGVFAGMHSLMMGASGWSTLSSTQFLVLGGLSAAVIGSVAVSLPASIRPGSRQWMHPLVPIFLLAGGFPLVAGLLFPASRSEHFVRDGIRCLAGGLMVSAMAGGITYAVARQGYSTDWTRSGSLVGAVGGIVAIVALQISCPTHEFGHLAMWHGLTILLSISSGFLMGRKLQPA